MKKSFSTANAPIPSKSVSQAVINGNLVYVCGQLGFDTDTGRYQFGDITLQTRYALTNLKNILEAAGSDMQHVISTTCYISSMSLFDEFDKEYYEFFSEEQPARACIAVKEIYLDLDIEITCIASLISDGNE